jgi:AcrR family transcriptional regulator
MRIEDLLGGDGAGAAGPRERLAAAAASLARERGLAAVTARDLRRLAGLSRAEQAALPPTLEGLLAEAVEVAAEALFAPFADPPGEWLAALALALRGFYGRVAAAPARAELLLLGARPPGPPPGAARVEQGRRALRALIARGRAEAPPPPAEAPPPFVEGFLAHGYLGLATMALARGTAAELPGQATELAYLAGIHFLPEAEAARRLGRGRGG